MADDVRIRVDYKELKDASDAAADLYRFMQALTGNQFRLHFDYTQVRDAVNSIQQASQQIQQFNQAIQNQGQQRENALIRSIEQNVGAIRNENNAWRDLEQQRQRQHEEEMRRQEEQRHALQAQLDLVNGIASAIQGLGSISGLTENFANGIGNAFSQMSGLFSTNLTDYLTRNLANRFVDSLVGSVSSVTNRYDILRTFVPYMNLTGVDEATAMNAQNRVDMSIRGLPIGLDEATQRMRRYNMYLNDLDRATNLTIGIQSAIMAGGAGEQYRTQAYNMIERMLATGDLSNIRQWQSLLVGLGVSQRFIEKELGLEQGSLLSEIRAKTISVEEFLGALERLGSGTTAAALDMQEALEIYKSTLESWISNIEFAVTRGNERVLGAINDTLEAVSGLGITGYMEIYRDFLNDVFYGTADFIRANPDLVKSLLDDAKQLIDAISQFSASDIAKGAVKNISTLVDVVTSMLGRIPPGELEEFISFATVLAGPLGELFKTVSSGAPALIAIYERFKDFDFQLLIDSIAKHVDAMADLYEKLLDIFTDEQLADIIAFGLVWGGPVKTVLNSIGELVRTLGIFALSGGVDRVMAVLGALSRFFGNVGGAAAGAVAPYAGALGVGAAVLGGAYYIGTTMQNARDERMSSELYIDSNITGRSRLDLMREQLASAQAGFEDARSRLAASNGTDRTATAEMQWYRDMINVLEGRISSYERDIIHEGRTNADNRHGIDPTDATNGMGGYAYSGEAAQEAQETEIAVQSLIDTYSELYDAAHESVSGQAQLFTDLTETVGDAYDRLVAEEAQYVSWQQSVEEIMKYATEDNKEVIKNIVEGGVDAIDQLKDAIVQLESDPHALDGLQRQLHNTQSAMDEASDEASTLITMLQLLGSEAFTTGEMMGINLEYGIRSGMTGAVAAAWELANQIRAAYSSISTAAWSYINSVQYRDIESPEGALYRFTGGLVYAANGKLIPFIPRGTDTVPAMLTPGEFVMNKRAVDTFGADFMRYVNNLNIGAAYDRLIHTDIHAPRSGITNNYNTRDNHASVNQTIVNGGPGFTYRQASRFVRSL